MSGQPLYPHDALALGIVFDCEGVAGVVMAHCAGDQSITAHCLEVEDAHNLVKRLEETILKAERHNSGEELIDRDVPFRPPSTLPPMDEEPEQDAPFAEPEPV